MLNTLKTYKTTGKLTKIKKDPVYKNTYKITWS